MSVGIVHCQLITFRLVQDWFNRSVSADLDEALLDEILKPMHCIMGNGIAILLAGVLPFELVIPGQLLFYFLLMKFFHLLFGFDLFLASSSFGADLQNTNLILIIWPCSKKS